jgi:hypothetical protein
MIKWLQHKPVVRFLVVYVLLSIPWPGFTQVYSACFRAVAGAIFTRFSGGNELTFEKLEGNQPHQWDTRIEIANPARMRSDGSGPVRDLDFGAHGFGWGPMAMLIALVVTTPLPWPRRRRVLLVGAIWLHVFILFSLAVSIWAESAELTPGALTPFAKAIRTGANAMLRGQLGLGIPLLIWFLATFQRGDKVGRIALFVVRSPQKSPMLRSSS